MVVKQVALPMPLAEVGKLLQSEWHEVRLCGLLLTVRMMQQAVPKKRDSDIALLQQQAKRRERLVEFYLQHAQRANNWDLVDLSAPYILGVWMLHPGARLPSIRSAPFPKGSIESPSQPTGTFAAWAFISA